MSILELGPVYTECWVFNCSGVMLERYLDHDMDYFAIIGRREDRDHDIQAYRRARSLEQGLPGPTQ